MYQVIMIFIFFQYMPSFEGFAKAIGENKVQLLKLRCINLENNDER